MADNAFFYGRVSFRVLVLQKKMYNVGQLGFFVRAQPTLCFGRNWHVPINSARNTLAHLGKKIFAIRLHAYFIQGLNKRLNSRHRS